MRPTFYISIEKVYYDTAATTPSIFTKETLGYPSQLSYMLNAKRPATLCLAFIRLTTPAIFSMTDKTVRKST